MVHPLLSLLLRPCFYVRQQGLLLLTLTGLVPAAFGQSFAAPQIYSAANTLDRVNGVAVADVNGDRQPDLVTACEHNSNVGVLLNIGTGTFAPTLLNATGRNTALGGVAVADVNADGKPDIVTGTFGTVLVLLGKGDGTFAPAVSYATGTNTNIVGIAVVDVSSDGQPDIIAADSYTNNVRVLLGSRDGTFAPAIAYAAGTSSYAGGLAVADINADGQLDVLTVDATHFAVQVLLGKGAGTFAPATSYSTGANSWPTSLSVGDVNADGKLDLVTANSNFFGMEGAAGVLLGSGTGSFSSVMTYPTGPTSHPTSITLADVTGDGKPDIITANNNPFNLEQSVAVLPGTGTGVFQLGRFYSPGNSGITGDGASSVTVTDVSGDGKPDIIAANHTAGFVGVLRNTSAFLAIRSPELSGQLTLWPNPAVRNMVVTFAATNLPPQVRQVEATLVSVVGQPVGHTRVSIAQGVARATLFTTGLTSGLYLLQVCAYDAQGSVMGIMPTQRLSLE
jgi:hypothetical protein